MSKNSLWKILTPKIQKMSRRRTFYDAREYDKYKELMGSSIFYDFNDMPGIPLPR